MLPVRRIPEIVLLFSLVLICSTACSSSSDLDDLPAIIPDDPVIENPDAQPAPPTGYIADPEKKYFHRLDCPDAKEVKPSIRQFYSTPFDALNEGYAPCEYCEPMVGWK